MEAATDTFAWKSGNVTVQKPNGFSKQRVWRLRQTLARLDDLKGIEYVDAATMAYYLAHTVAVEGSIGFPVPFKNPTPDEVLAFVMALGEEDDDLITLWDDTISDLKHATNDPDLLPPDEVEEKKAKTRA